MTAPGVSPGKGSPIKISLQPRRGDPLSPGWQPRAPGPRPREHWNAPPGLREERVVAASKTRGCHPGLSGDAPPGLQEEATLLDTLDPGKGELGRWQGYGGMGAMRKD